MRKQALIAAALATAVPAQASAESWLCIADMATGFKYNSVLKRWDEASFNVAESRYIIRPSRNPAWKYEVTAFGKPTGAPEAWCKAEPSSYGYLLCNSYFGEFKFNTGNLRYIKTYLAGYVEILPTNSLVVEGGDTPNMEIGKCSLL